MGEDASEERSLFERSRERTAAYVASDLGAVRVDLAPDRIGEFSLVERCTARAVAASGSQVAVATPDAVLVDRGRGFAASGFGPAVAVGVDHETVLAASPGGDVGRLDAATPDGETAWESVGRVAEPRRFDGALLAAEGGVYRVAEELTSLGLTAVRDVAAAGPYAATDEGLFRRADEGWHCEYDSVASVVAATDGRAHAVDADGLLERGSGVAGPGDTPGTRDEGGRWERVATPDDASPVDIAHGPGLYAVTEAGEFLLAAADAQATDGRGGWRSRTLGVGGVTGLAVVAYTGRRNP